jgi:hypothetical protein
MPAFGEAFDARRSSTDLTILARTRRLIGVSSGCGQVSYFNNETEMASRPFWVFTTFIATRCPSASARSPARSTTVAWRNTSLPPSSQATKPNPFSGLNHLMAPSMLVAVAGSGRSRPDDALGGGRTCVRGAAAALVSTARTDVT